MEICERIYLTERKTLSKYAALSENTKGRMVNIEEDKLRTAYMRDRDRIVHCKSFRRLKDKTQVFLYPDGSHYRTRLTHTMEVSQIARTIARALMLNEDLTEAIALGHDLGHTPFGHAGERVLANFVEGFEHNRQSLRVVDKLENGTGLNLTWEVRDGILNHKKSGKPATLEGMAVSFADRIAYLNHDIDDTIRAGIFDIYDLPKHCINVLGHTHGERIDRMITDIVENSMDKPVLSMTSEVNEATNELREYMFTHVYENSPAKVEEKKVIHILTQLYEYYDANFSEVPDNLRANEEQDGKAQCIVDYLSGMTDRFAVNEFNRLFVPKNWSKY